MTAINCQFSVKKRGGRMTKATGKKNWIQKAIGKPGALHKALKVKKGQKIPVSKLRAAAKKPGKMGKRARLVLTLEKINQSKGK
jgi:hypothetical protein